MGLFDKVKSHACFSSDLKQKSLIASPVPSRKRYFCYKNFPTFFLFDGNHLGSSRLSFIRSSSNSNKRLPFLRDQNMAQWVSSLWFTTNRIQPLRFTFSDFVLLSKRDALISHHHYVPIELNISYVISKVATSRIRHLLKFTCFIVV